MFFKGVNFVNFIDYGCDSCIFGSDDFISGVSGCGEFVCKKMFVFCDFVIDLKIFFVNGCLVVLSI